MVGIVCQEVPFHIGIKNIQVQNKVVKYVHDGQEHVHNVQPSGSVTSTQIRAQMKALK